MIELNRLNGSPLLVNPDLIRVIESMPDTLLTFTDGEKVMVRNQPAGNRRENSAVQEDLR